MPPLPPSKDVLDALQHAVMPAAGGAAFVLCLFLVFGRWAAALGSAMAVIVGFCSANFTFDELSWERTGRVMIWKLDEASPAWHWLPKAALLLLVVGLLSRWLGLLVTHSLPERRWWGANLLVWAPRVAAVFVISGWLISENVATEIPWLRWAMASAMVLIWVTLDSLARSGAGADVAVFQAIIFYAAAAILLYAHTGRFMEIAIILGSAMFGIAVAAGVGKADTSGAVPATVAFLPGLVLGGRSSLAENQVPDASFWLVALAPLFLMLFLIPVLSRKNGWLVRFIRVALVLAPLITAVVLASQHEKLVFEESW